MPANVHRYIYLVLFFLGLVCEGIVNKLVTAPPALAPYAAAAPLVFFVIGMFLKAIQEPGDPPLPPSPEATPLAVVPPPPPAVDETPKAA